MKKPVLIGLAVGLLLIAGFAWAARPPARPQLKEATECVEVDIEAPGMAHPGDQVTLYGEVTNCGDEAGWVTLTGSLSKDGQEITSPPIRLYLAAGETRSKTMTIYIPSIPGIGGTYTACVTATIGSAEATDCTTMEVVPSGKGAPRRRAPSRR